MKKRWTPQSYRRPMINKKDLKVKKLYERGIVEPRTIAKKLGYSGEAVQSGIERVLQAFKNLGIIKTNATP